MSSNSEINDLVKAISGLFEDPDIRVGYGWNMPMPEPGSPQHIDITVETISRSHQAMIVQADEMLKAIRGGKRTAKEVARSIVSLYDALYPFPDMKGDIVKIQ